ncbi:hypothetical protein GIB67_006699 [Kingdonia uniflora]|uniref:Protein kinase domain-containing protein n=1 Tax=Kingdonia uniflora TaxID=39325 RepID=A0A7J7LYK3_9MAGN|nr:hypothetical protein GIB67_006699 [Kingdonia uniflora]
MASQNVGNQNDEGYMRELARLPRKFRYEDLQMATNNFQDKLGSGGSGSVFKGLLKDGPPIAVKRVEGAEYGKQIFEAEISTIASVQHVHLVRLRGYCSSAMETGGDSFVVYDLFPRGSLDAWIFPRTNGPTGQFLSWKLRYKVAVDVARALVYLHHDCCPRILHLDVKPENILLDDKFRAVLSDFGLSKLTNEDEIRSKMIRGTDGYRAPESSRGNQISDKCDIYSYGKVLLDLFFGQRYVCLDRDSRDIYVRGGNSALEERTFYAFLRERLTQKNLVDLIDKRVKEDGEVNELEANSLVHVALWCLEEDPKRRPREMQQVLYMLDAGNPDGIGAMVGRFANEFRIENAREGTPSGGCLLPEGSYSSRGLQCEGPCSGGGTLVVIVHVAQKLKRNHHLNPYALISLGSESKETKPVHEGLFSEQNDPQWMEEFSFSLGEAPMNVTLSVQVISVPSSYSYFYPWNELVGSAVINLSDVVEKKRTFEWYQLNDKRNRPTNGKIHIELLWKLA